MTTTSAAGTVAFDPLDQSLRFGDYPLYEEIRQAGGISWSAAHGGFWAVADFDLVKAIASDNVRFVSGPGVRIPPNGTPPTFALEYDRPQHTTHRAILTEAVGPRTAPGLEDGVRRAARALLPAGPDPVPFDLGAGYAFQLSLDVVFDLIGAPDGLKEEVELLAESLFLFRRPMPDGSDPAARLTTIMRDLVADRMVRPRPDWLSKIVGYQTAGDHRLSEREVHGAIVALLVGGHHSTARATGCLLAHIAERDDLQRLLRAEPGRLPDAVEEAIRLWTPLRWFARTATEDMQLGAARIRRGDRVLLLYAGANRDPRRYTDPAEFSLDRPRSRDHLAFGWGIHRCVGMPLAQLEIRVAVEEVFARSSWIELAGGITWTSSTEPRNIPVLLR
jgi:cytochrome P450